MTRRVIASVALPGGPIARAAVAEVAAREPEILVRHAMRIFLFASLIGRRRAVAVNSELLYVSALFLHAGLAPCYRHSDKRFEVDSADAVLAFLAAHGASAADAGEAWCAVALHTSFGLHPHMAPLTELLGAGVETELFASHFDELRRADREAVLRAWPRGPAFNELLLELWGDGIARRPATTFGNVGADVLERWDPDYRRVHFCGRVFGAKWED